MMHAKAVVVDRVWCSVGTYNLDHRSLRHNLEVNANILDRALAAQLAEQFELWAPRARARSPWRDWRRRPWTELPRRSASGPRSTTPSKKPIHNPFPRPPRCAPRDRTSTPLRRPV